MAHLKVHLFQVRLEDKRDHPIQAIRRNFSLAQGVIHRLLYVVVNQVLQTFKAIIQERKL